MSSGDSVSPRLVVTADDFGLSPEVDAGILESFLRGVVRSTALLVNFPDVADSVARLGRAPGLELGVHLNLTAGAPVLPPERVPSLVGANGRFHNFKTFFVQVTMARIEWDEVGKEWEAQIERGLGLGCRFSFLTSHQHVHMLPQAARVCAKLAHAYGVGAVRLSSFRLRNMLRPRGLKALVLAPFVPTVRRTFEREGIFCNDSIFEIPPRKPRAALLQLCRTIRRLAGGAHELVCHPGYVDPTLRARDSYVARRPIELAVLVHAEVRALFQTASIELTTYRALTGSPCAAESVHTPTNERPPGPSTPTGDIPALIAGPLDAPR